MVALANNPNPNRQRTVALRWLPVDGSLAERSLPRDRVDPIVLLQQREKLSVFELQFGGAFEKGLGCHGEKLGLIGRAVVIEKRLLVLVGGVDQLSILRINDAFPLSRVVIRVEGDVAAHFAIEPVECMSELMDGDVSAIVFVASSSYHVLPREHDRPALPSLARAMFDTASGTSRILTSAEDLRVHQDGADVIEIEIFDTQQHQASVSGNGHLHFFGDD